MVNFINVFFLSTGVLAAISVLFVVACVWNLLKKRGHATLRTSAVLAQPSGDLAPPVRRLVALTTPTIETARKKRMAHIGLRPQQAAAHASHVIAALPRAHTAHRPGLLKAAMKVERRLAVVR